MNFLDSKSYEWLVPTFAKLSSVLQAELDGNLLRIIREDSPPVTLGLITKHDVLAADIAAFFGGAAAIDFVVNTPNAGIFKGDAIALCQANGTSWGGVADGMRAINSEQARQYVHPEFRFVLRGLDQHSSVRETQFLDSRRLRVVRHGLPSLDLYIDVAYQATAASVREAVERCAPFDIYAAINPNSYPTAEAVSVAGALGIEVLRWGQILKRLNQ